MILGTKARYAMMAMTELAESAANTPIALAQLAKRQEITVPYLEQIFSKLRQAGLVKSVRGPGGGYALARAPQDISAFDIVSAVEESVKMTRCEKKPDQGCMATRSRCRTHHLWEGLEQHICDYLRSVNLANIGKPTSGASCAPH